MGLKSIFQNAAKTAMKAAGDVAEDVIYVEVNDDGITDRTETQHPVTMIPGEFSLRERSELENVQSGDMKGTVLAPELPCKPKDGDFIIRKSGLKMWVKDFVGDPAGATYMLQLRDN